MKKLILVFAIIFTVGLTLNACKSEKKEDKTEQNSLEKKEEMAHATYQCPMKCEQEKTYEKEGTCPVCKMKLMKISKEDKGGDDKDNEDS